MTEPRLFPGTIAREAARLILLRTSGRKLDPRRKARKYRALKPYQTDKLALSLDDFSRDFLEPMVDHITAHLDVCFALEELPEIPLIQGVHECAVANVGLVKVRWLEDYSIDNDQMLCDLSVMGR